MTFTGDDTVRVDEIAWAAEYDDDAGGRAAAEAAHRAAPQQGVPQQALPTEYRRYWRVLHIRYTTTTTMPFQARELLLSPPCHCRSPTQAQLTVCEQSASVHLARAPRARFGGKAHLARAARNTLCAGGEAPRALARALSSLPRTRAADPRRVRPTPMRGVGGVRVVDNNSQPTTTCAQHTACACARCAARFFSTRF